MSTKRRRTFRPALVRLCAAGALAVGLAAPATASAGVLDSVAGWWPMYEGSGQTVHDLSGKGNHGTLGSTALEPQNITVSTWVRSAGSPGTNRYIIGKGAGNCDAASYGLYTTYSGGLRFYIYDTTRHERYSGLADPDVIWNGKWHHVAGTWDGLSAKLFIDGKLVPGQVETGGVIDYEPPTTGDTGIGGFLGTCDLYYTGDVDDVAIFSQALPVDRYWSALSLLFPRPLR
jgi:hypothetical protein